MTQTLVGLAGWIVAGMLLSFGYFGGLWLTVRNLRHRRHPQRAMLESFVIRAAVLMWAIYQTTGGALPAVVALLAGFVAARTAWTRAVIRVAAE